jgi:hypothetical protein
MYHVISIAGKYSNHSIVAVKDVNGNVIKSWRLKNVSERKLSEIVDAVKTAIDYAISRDFPLEIMLEMADLRIKTI